MKLFDEIPYLKNDYIVIKKLQEDDAPVLEEMASNEHVTRYLPAFLFEFSFPDKRQAIEQMYGRIFEEKESLILGIYPRKNFNDGEELENNAVLTEASAALTEAGSPSKGETERLAGLLEFYNYDPNWNKASIGIRLNEPAWHKGFAENTLKLAMDYLLNWTDIKRITAHIMTVNQYSMQAVMRVGFRRRRSAVLEDWGLGAPVIVDKFVYEKWGNIKYVKIGSGKKTMVILPGLSLKSTLGGANEIAKNYKAFSDYTIYLFDDRDNISPSYTIRERAGDVAAEMKTLGLSDAYVFGASMGGVVGQYLAIDHPDLVKKLFLSSTYSRLSPNTKGLIAEWM